MDLLQSPRIEILSVVVAVAAIGATAAYFYLTKETKGMNFLKILSIFFLFNSIFWVFRFLGSFYFVGIAIV